MPRENKEPVAYCADCRFELSGYCRRNPPTAIVADDHVGAVYPQIRNMKGCFAGEPKNKPDSLALCKSALELFSEALQGMNTERAIRVLSDTIDALDTVRMQLREEVPE